MPETLDPRIVALASVQPQPWRNGGGVQRDLYAWPTPDAWHVRVSVADIEADGPFSAYPGVDRWFAIVEGAGVELAFADRRFVIALDDAPLRFDGSEVPACTRIAGPTRALNLMLRGVPGAIAPAIDHRAWSPAGSACGLYATVDGVCHTDLRPERVRARTLLWFDEPPPVLRFAADRDVGSRIGYWLQAATR